jgi:ArsR family transcriptional regulator
MSMSSPTTRSHAPSGDACCAPGEAALAGCCAPLDVADLSPADAAATAALFKALADAARVRLLNLIATAPGPVCQCELTAPLGLTQGTVSHHLKKLVAAGLLEREQRGIWAYYSISDETVRRLQDVVAFDGGTR